MPTDVRVTCGFCGVANDIASVGAVRVARRLEQLGVKVPERPMRVSDIEEHFAEQAAVEREKRRMAFIVIGVLVVIAAIVGLLIALGT